MFKRKKRQDTNLINGTKLNGLLDQRLKGESIDLEGNGDLEVFFRKVEDAINEGHEAHHDTHKSVNHLSQYIMKMDFVNEMLMKLADQQDSVEMVSSTSEEMSASIVEIAEHVAANTEAANNSVAVSVSSTEELRDAVQLIDEAFSMTGQAKERVGDVTMQASKINEMVGIIESVAGQTNLLALNASIEAARAGEAGKGFAVVADEIRKLAESTKESVELIQGVVNELNTTVTSSVEAMEQATESFKKGVDFINKASGSVEKSREEMSQILSGMESISEQIQQQTAATQEVTANIQDINGQTAGLYTTTNQTGKAVSDIGFEVNDIRMKLMENDQYISVTDMLDIAITDHLEWRWKVYNMVSGNGAIDPKTIGDHHSCRLGQWIKNQGSKIPELKNQLAAIEGPHRELHQYAKEAAEAYNRGDLYSARSCLAPIDEVSNTIVEALTDMMAGTLANHETAKSAALFAWSNKLTVYNKEIDDQHKKLLELGQTLQDFRNSGSKSREKFLSIVTELKNYTVYHFDAEEKIMEQGRYPDLERHKEIHKNFVKEVTSVDFENFDYEDKEALKELIVFLSKWVLTHIRHEDFKYSNYVTD